MLTPVLGNALFFGAPTLFVLQAPNKRTPIANNFMAGPPQHPLWSYTIHKLRSTRQRVTVFATGPSFLTHTIKEYETQLGKRGVELQPCQNQTVCDLRRGDGLVVYKMPVVYAAGWKGAALNPCKSGATQELDACAEAAEQAGRNGSVLATFWTMTWKADEANFKKTGQKISRDLDAIAAKTRR